MTDDLIRRSACEVVAALGAGDLRPHDALDAAQGRIESADHLITALPTRCFERARDHADRPLAVPSD